MPIAYLDVPEGIQVEAKKKMFKSIYEALTEAYPFPPDHRVFLNEWPLESVSQDGRLGSEPPRPVLAIHAPQGASAESKRRMVIGINEAVAAAYDNLPEFIIFIHEHPLELVAINGNLHADNRRRVEEQKAIYSSSSKPSAADRD
jgi:phenylpyruvate tautomerase PptA (4-oxalocrotonate tautomerase family)